MSPGLRLAAATISPTERQEVRVVGIKDLNYQMLEKNCRKVRRAMNLPASAPHLLPYMANAK
jgi:hypothetical protein